MAHEASGNFRVWNVDQWSSAHTSELPLVLAAACDTVDMFMGDAATCVAGGRWGRKQALCLSHAVVCREDPRATLGQAIVRVHVGRCLAHCADMYTLPKAAHALARSAPSRYVSHGALCLCEFGGLFVVLVPVPC